MPMTQTRRRFLTTLSLAGAAGLVRAPRALAAEGPLETTTVRIVKSPGICLAPQYVAEELLRAEGFHRYPLCRCEPVDRDQSKRSARGEVDFSSNFASNFVQAIDAGEPITVLAGVHVGCYELFAQRRHPQHHRPKGKSVGVQAWDRARMCS